jgi:enhancing lycopene biosynthesis protein 2
MIRRLLIPLLGAGLLLAATAGSAFAKCEGPDKPEFCKSVAVSLMIGGGGGVLQAGTLEAVTIDMSLSEQPYEATSVLLSFARVADGTTVLVPATASVRPGLWTADVLLPNGGSWTVVAEIVALDGAESSVALDTMQVAKPPALPPSTTPVTPPPAAPPILPILFGFAGLAAVGLAWQTLRARRRAGAGVAAPVGSAATADQT